MSPGLKRDRAVMRFILESRWVKPTAVLFFPGQAGYRAVLCRELEMLFPANGGVHYRLHHRLQLDYTGEHNSVCFGLSNGFSERPTTIFCKDNFQSTSTKSDRKISGRPVDKNSHQGHHTAIAPHQPSNVVVEIPKPSDRRVS